MDDEFAPVRDSDPVTSHMAAARVNVSALEGEFIAALKHHGHPLTTTEIARYWNRPRDSFSPRPPALLRKHLIVRAGKRICTNAEGTPRLMIAFALPKQMPGETKTKETP